MKIIQKKNNSKNVFNPYEENNNEDKLNENDEMT